MLRCSSYSSTTHLVPLSPLSAAAPLSLVCLLFLLPPAALSMPSLPHRAIVFIPVSRRFLMVTDDSFWAPNQMGIRTPQKFRDSMDKEMSKRERGKRERGATGKRAFREQGAGRERMQRLGDDGGLVFVKKFDSGNQN